MKYFAHINTLDELKKEYRRLVMLHHPDRGGDTATMQAINAEYAERHEALKNAWNNTHDADHQCTETPEEFRHIVEALLNLGGLDIELCGSWLWISGNTLEHKDALKAAGCRWSANKKCGTGAQNNTPHGRTEADGAPLTRSAAATAAR